MPENRPPTAREVLALIQHLLNQDHVDGLKRLSVDMEHGVDLHLSWGRGSTASPEPADAEEPEEIEAVDTSLPFVPTALQKKILAVLDGHALRTERLAVAVNGQGRLYKPGGLKELQSRKLVMLHNQLGHYRPDAPPEELREKNQEISDG